MILVEGLCVRYGAVHAVDDVSFRVERGEIVGFLGPNGAGKSSTMRALAGCLVPHAGRVEVAGRTSPASDPQARGCVGYLPESTPLYRGMRVDRYLDFAARVRGLGRRERRAAIGRVAERVGLTGAAGAASHLGRRIDELSKGYRQRVGLAQALLGEPPVLVLDEPTSGLDPTEVQRMRALIRSLGEERTVLLSTHVLGEVEQLCPRVIILAGGRKVADGPADDPSAGGEQALVVRLQANGPRAEALVAAALGAGPHGPWKLLSSAPAGNGRWRLEVAVGDAFGAAEAISARAAAEGLALSELRPRTASLEAVFLRAISGQAPTAPAPSAEGDHP